MSDPLDRAKVLLAAANEILRKSHESTYVVSAMELSAEYDGTECDGNCLAMDIENWFAFEVDSPLKNEFAS